MRHIDEIHLQLPFYGGRRTRDELEDRGHKVNRKRVQRLMRLMGLMALYPRRRTGQPGKGHKVYPYLLRELSIERANQAWASDIKISMDGKGPWVNNVFVERLWRSVNYEDLLPLRMMDSLLLLLPLENLTSEDFLSDPDPCPTIGVHLCLQSMGQGISDFSTSGFLQL
jgi:putative transposase